MAAPMIEDAATRDVEVLLAKGIVTRRLALAAGKRWRQRVMVLAHRHGLRTFDGQTGSEAWVCVAGERAEYLRLRR